MYDFDHTLDHRTDGSLRWKQPAGRADVIGMGTADLDYFCPPAVALRANTTASPRPRASSRVSNTN